MVFVVVWTNFSVKVRWNWEKKNFTLGWRMVEWPPKSWNDNIEATWRLGDPAPGLLRTRDPNICSDLCGWWWRWPKIHSVRHRGMSIEWERSIIIMTAPMCVVRPSVRSSVHLLSIWIMKRKDHNHDTRHEKNMNGN